MPTKSVFKVSIASLICAIGLNVAADGHKVYGPQPVTVSGYTGSKTNSVSYTGQMARHVLHNSLKKIVSKSDSTEASKAKMMEYYGKADGRSIVSPATKGAFVVSPASVDAISKGKDLRGKTYKGVITAFPDNMTGPEVVDFMIDKAANTNGGYDPLTGLDYTQLISKFLMGAVFYNQAVDNYLDEKLEADNKPNNKPYKDGAAYTGKEHVWDEAFGYFGAPAHALTLTPADVYNIAKQKEEAFGLADYNSDGEVDLYQEMTYAHAYYAAGFDKKGGTNYLESIMTAFIEGRQLITDANGAALTDGQRSQLKAYAKTIATNWEKVIAEAVFKYAGSTYKDLQKLQTIIESNGDASEAFRKYAKHWGELKGFSMALQVGGKDLGETAVKLNRMIGFSPVHLGGTQITGIDGYYNYTQGESETMGEYMIHMLKIQRLMADTYNLQAKANDQMAEMEGLVESLGESVSAEND